MTPEIDVCLLLEGTYPYVTGGVSSWVHQLIAGLPELRFGLVCLVPDEQWAGTDRYDVPANVVYRQNVALFGSLPGPARRNPLERLQAAFDRSEPPRAVTEALRAMHQAPTAGRCPFFAAFERLQRPRRQPATSLLSARSSWALVRDFYRRNDRGLSLIDYFWTWRATHAPMLRLLDVALPPAKAYHTISTGYAGLLASLAKLRQGVGMALTEHGLFTREREMEIFQAAWIYQQPAGLRGFESHEAAFKAWWRAKFQFLGQTTYHHADRIVTLHAVNRQAQMAAGAPADKLVIQPNGIVPEAYAPLRAPRDWHERPFRVGLIGRVVPIKDVKTFLRAVAMAAREQAIEAYVLGPGDEEPGYFAECQALADLLGIAHLVTFTGRVDVHAWLPRLDLNVLTSISESQPLVILEAAAAGVPSVATDVGACREMLAGQAGEDAALGPSGLVTPVVSPEATARAILALARDPALHAAMSAAGIARVERFYRQSDVYAFYRTLYQALARITASGHRRSA